jgi:hypothetical protein
MIYMILSEQRNFDAPIKAPNVGGCRRTVVNDWHRDEIDERREPELKVTNALLYVGGAAE